jgi:hypothetical protein
MQNALRSADPRRYPGVPRGFSPPNGSGGLKSGGASSVLLATAFAWKASLAFDLARRPLQQRERHPPERSQSSEAEASCIRQARCCFAVRKQAACECRTIRSEFVLSISANDADQDACFAVGRAEVLRARPRPAAVPFPAGRTGDPPEWGDTSGPRYKGHRRLVLLRSRRLHAQF